MHENAQFESETAGRQNHIFWRFKVKALEDLSNTLLEELRFFSAARSIDIGSGVDFYDEVQRFECDLIARALKLTGGHQRKAARLIGLKATTLNAKLKHYGISATEISSVVDEPISPDTLDISHTDERDAAPGECGGTSGEAVVDEPAPAFG